MKVVRGFLLTAGAILVFAGIAFCLRPIDFMMTSLTWSKLFTGSRTVRVG